MICAECKKETFCLPMGKNNGLICQECFTGTIANQSFAQFAKKHGLDDIENMTGDKISKMVVMAVATILAKASLFGINVKKIEVGDVSKDLTAMTVELNYQEFDEVFLPKLKLAATGDLPDHVKAAVDALGSTMGKFNA